MVFKKTYLLATEIDWRTWVGNNDEDVNQYQNL